MKIVLNVFAIFSNKWLLKIFNKSEVKVPNVPIITTEA